MKTVVVGGLEAASFLTAQARHFHLVEELDRARHFEGCTELRIIRETRINKSARVQDPQADGLTRVSQSLQYRLARFTLILPRVLRST
jgi:hypothetical protein